MTPSPTATSPRPARASTLRIGAVVICIGAALGAALVEKRASAPVAGIAANFPATPTANEILGAIPVRGGSPETAKALSSALGKVRAKPEDAALWVRVGNGLAQAFRDTADEKYYDHAEAAYQEALRLDPQSVDALIGRAWVTGGRHDFDQSKTWAKRALALDTGNAAAFGILGDAAVELGDYDEAFEHYQQMMDLKPDLSSWSRGAHLLWLTGDGEKAKWLMDKAIKAGSPVAENTAWCRARLAMMLFHEGALDDAALVLEPALKAAPNNTQVLLAAGRVAVARDDFDGAEKHFQAVLENAPNHDALVALGDLRAAKGESEAAETYYAQVVSLDALQTASAGHSHLALAKFYADHDRQPVEALRLAEARKLTQNVHEADTLAWVYFKNGDVTRATEAMTRALRYKTPDAEIHYHAGMIAAATGDAAAAQQHLRQALRLNPRFSVLQTPHAVKALEQLGGTAANAVLPATSGAVR